VEKMDDKKMDDEKIILAGLWIATMLIYLLGDVLRIFAGDFTAGEMDGKPVASYMWIVTSVIMSIPIIMILLSLTLNPPANRIINIVFASFFILFNLLGIKGYKPYDQILLGISFIFNGLVIYSALKWK